MKIIRMYEYRDGYELPREPEIVPWVYPSIPWTGNPNVEHKFASPGDPMEWTFGLYSRVVIRKLFREGGRAYVMELEFDDREMENWLESYIEYKPKEAMDLLVKMLQKAWDKLKKKG